MANYPPKTKKQKCIYFRIFIFIAIIGLVLAIWQYKEESEKDRVLDQIKKNTESASFQILLNGNIVTNHSVFSIRSSRKFSVCVKNVSETTAERVEVDVHLPLIISETNIIANDWEIQPTDTDEKNLPSGTHYRWSNPITIPAGYSCQIPPIEISTNFHLPYFGIGIDVSDSKSSIETLFVRLKL